MGTSKWNRRLSKVLSVVLSMVMVFNFMPAVAFAAPRTGYIYELDTTIESGSQYLIVVANSAMNTSRGSSAVTKSGDYISSAVTDSMLWTITSSGSGSTYTIMNGTNYLYANTNGDLSYGATVPNPIATYGYWSFITNNKFDVNGRHLYLSGTNFILRGSVSSTISLYKKIPLAVASIAVTHVPTKTAYIEGQSFDPAGMQITATYNDGSTEVVTSSANYSWSPNGALATTDNAITISYGGKTATQAITVAAKVVIGIAITTPPSKTAYVEGQSFSTAGMVVTATYNDGSTVPVTGYTWSPNGALVVANNTITVSYSGKTATQAISVVAKVITGIAVTTQPSKTAYVEGQSFSTAGMVVTATYNDGSTVPVTGYTWSPNGALAVANNTITISYSGKTTTQAITVAAKAITSIAITTPPAKTAYVEGQSFDTAGMVVTATYNDDSTAPLTGYVWSPDGALTIGDHTITITYLSKTTTQAITVVAKAIASIAVTTPPTNTAYIEGQSFSAAGMVVTATYNDDSTVEVTGYTWSPNGVLATTDEAITVTYEGKSTTQAITVAAKTVTSIEITAEPDKIAYIEGQSFSPVGMVLVAHYDNGTSAAVTGYTWSPNGLLAITDETITVAYEGKTAMQAITVAAKKLENITISTAPDRTAYIEGLPFEPAGMVVTAHYDNSSSAAVTDYTYTPDGLLATTDDTVTVTYEGKTATQAITVAAKKLENITISTAPDRTAYIEGLPFEPAGMVVMAHYDNGFEAAVTGYTCTPDGLLATTDEAITVTYEGKTATQAITVAAKSVSSIEITAEPTRVAYIEGLPFEPAGMVVTAHYDNGTEAAVTGYTWSPDGLLATTNETITVSYEGKVATQAITVAAKKLENITISTAPDRIAYIEGLPFEPAGMVVTAHYDNGSEAAVMDYTYAPNGLLATTDEAITVTYEGKSATQAITVAAKQLVNITISNAPDRIAYIEGLPFEPAGMVVMAHYDNGSSVAVTDYTYTPDGLLATTDDIVTVTYEGKKATQAITVAAKQLISLTIKTAPTRIDYVEGLFFDPTDMIVQAHYDNGNSEIVADYTYSPVGALEITDNTITISYGGKSVTQAITVAAKSVVSIEITAEPDKTAYIEGLPFEPAGMVVTAHYDNGTKAAVTGYTWSPNGLLSTTNEAITVTYEGKTATQAITVAAKKLTGISISSAPDRIAYIEGLPFETAGMVVTAHYDNGSEAAVTGYTWSPNGALTTAVTAITVSYEGETATQAITVAAKQLTGITISTAPDRTAYIEGLPFEPAGMIVIAHYDNGSEAAVTGYTWSPNGLLATTNEAITVTYEGKTATQAITVAAKSVTSIEITNEPDRTAYIEGLPFEPAGMVVTAHYDNGSEAAVTGYTCTPNRLLATTDEAITVTYEGKTATQAITVAAKQLTGITISTAPDRTAYIEGLPFEPAGMVVTAHYDNGDSEAVTGYTCTPNRLLAITDETITVTFEGKTATQAITVAAKKLTGISISSAPDRIAYIEGLPFEPAGMVVTAHYDNGDSAAVTGYTWSPNGALTTAVTAITVSYEGETATQAITVLSNNKDLSQLTTSSGTLSPSFDAAKADYAVLLDKATPSTVLTATAASTLAAITVDGVPGSNKTVTLENGKSQAVRFLVTAQSGETKTYTVVVSRAEYGSFKFTVKDTVGNIYPGVGISVYSDEAMTQLMGSGVSDTTGMVTISGLSTAIYWVVVTSVPAGFEKPTVKVPLPAQDGIATEYILSVQKTAVEDFSYESWQLKGIIATGVLSPAFKPDTMRYTLTLGESTRTTTIRPQLADSTSKLYINGRRTTYKTVSLNPGEKTSVKIQVKTRAGKSAYYYVTVVRAKSTNAYLSRLTVSAGKLQPAFNKTVTAYTVSLANTQSSVRITPTVADTKYAHYSITVNGRATTNRTVSLNAGQSKTMVITVKAQSGKTIAYTVVISRAISHNANLANLKVSKGKLVPAFSPDLLSYSLALTSAQSSVTLTMKTADTVYGSYAIKVNGRTSGRTIYLNKGETKTVEITVKAQDRSTKKYVLVITRAK